MPTPSTHTERVTETEIVVYGAECVHFEQMADGCWLTVDMPDGRQFEAQIPGGRARIMENPPDVEG